MSEKLNRTRRSQRYAQTPERVSAAAQNGSGALQSADAVRDAISYEQQMAAQQRMLYEQEMARRQYEAQQEYARQQYAAQQEYARQQYAQEQARRQRQQERERISSETSSHGAFRGYTGGIPNMGTPADKPAANGKPKKKKGHKDQKLHK